MVKSKRGDDDEGSNNSNLTKVFVERRTREWLRLRLRLRLRLVIGTTSYTSCVEGGVGG